jgi:hypothetical protein
MTNIDKTTQIREATEESTRNGLMMMMMMNRGIRRLDATKVLLFFIEQIVIYVRKRRSLFLSLRVIVVAGPRAGLTE